jgi:YVTN family beta-propeller protein
MKRMVPTSLGFFAMVCLACSSAPSESSATSSAEVTATDSLRDVLLVGNSAAGTVSIVDGRSYQTLGTIDVVPDMSARMWAIYTNPIHAIAYGIVTEKQKIKHFEPSGGQRFVDDVFVSPDGTTLYVSRSNLGDVAAFDLTQCSHPMIWRTDIDGYKADHATLSPDGTRLVVSATASDKAEVLDARTGIVVGTFPTGHYPHQNDYSADGKHIYNGSIGDVSLPSLLDIFKGNRLLTVVDAATLAPVKTYSLPEGIRPSVITADETTMFAQLSYFNGVVKYDLVSGAIVGRSEQPMSDFAKANYPTKDDYPHDSAHHGLAMSGDGSRLCDLGTIDNTVSIVTTSDLAVQSTIDVGLIPYWASTSSDGTRCFVSLSGDNAVAVVDYATGEVVTRINVGKFPQRNRLGRIPESAVALLAQ